MISADLSGKTALVTGGASGIGLAAVELFAGCGARVAIGHLDDDPRGPEAVARLTAEGRAVLGAPGNVAEPASCRAMVAAAIDRLGRLDILINNAGTAATVLPIEFEELDRMTEEFWRTILDTNLLGPFRCAHAAAPALRAARGAIVNTASVAGLGRRGSSLAYGVSKAGLINLTQGLSKALAPDVRVNAVAPGLIETGWTAPWPAEKKEALRQKSLVGRLGRPLDIAEAMLFLAAGGAYITGQLLVVDGGLE